MNYLKVIWAAIRRKPVIAYCDFSFGYCPPSLSTCERCKPYFCRCGE